MRLARGEAVALWSTPSKSALLVRAPSVSPAEIVQIGCALFTDVTRPNLCVRPACYRNE